jgi:hypothetical protein
VVVVGEDVWCDWCEDALCRDHYDAKAHGCRYTNVVSLSRLPPSLHTLIGIGQETKQECEYIHSLSELSLIPTAFELPTKLGCWRHQGKG